MDEGGGSMTRKITATLYLLLIIVVVGLIAIPWVLNVISELAAR